MRIEIKKLLLNGLVLGSVAIPGMLYGAVIAQDRQWVMRHLEADTKNTMQIFATDAKNILDTHALVGRLVDQYIRSMSWEDIAQSQSLHKYLANLVRGYPQIESIWLIDSEGNVRNSSAAFTTPLNANDRDYFIAQRERDMGVYIGQTVHDKVFEEDVFNVAQRRTGSTDKFDGVVVVSAQATHFNEIWNKVDISPGSTAILRNDGAVLARNSPIDADAGVLAGNLMQQIGKHIASVRDVAMVAAHEHLYAYQKVENFPIYVGHEVNVESAMRVWQGDLYTYGVFFAVGTLGLLSLAVGDAYRRQQWHDTATELHGEIKRHDQVADQLRQAEKTEVLSEIADKIAHDFGNILSVIVGSYDMLEANPGDCKFLEMGQDAANRGVQAVQSLLAFVRRQPQSIEMFDLGAVLSGMRFLIIQSIGPTIELVIEPVCCTPCWIKADRSQIELTILNIVENACDAMPWGGQVRISTRSDTVHMGGNFVALSIADTGVGMPPDVVARAFEPFYSTKPQAVGLGLSMALRFAQESHGSASIDSEPEHGSTVTLWLPVFAPPRV